MSAHPIASTLAGVVAGLSVLTASPGQTPRPPARLIAIFVVDGLRPDSINTRDTPTIARLRAEGVEYINSHSIFPTVTRLNTATLATGTLPVLHGIVANSMFVPGVDARAPFDTGDYRQLLALEESDGRAVTADTLGEVLARHGRRLVTLSSGSTGNGFLLNPAARRGAGIAIHGLFDRGLTSAYPKDVSDLVLRRFGSPPPDPDDLGQMTWTDTVLREYVLPELGATVVIDWMGPLDAAQHAHGVGSPQALDALRRIDESLGRTVARIESLGLLDGTDIIVTSDHGFAHHTDGVDVTDALIRSGLKADRTSTDLVVASQGQSVLFYLPGSAPGRVAALVQFLQRQPWADLVFTSGGAGGRGAVPGTFSFDLIGAAHASRAPDVMATFAWTSRPNAFGAPGGHTISAAATGPIAGQASGHGGLNPWVVRNTFVVRGPGFAPRRRIETPMSLADVTPTVLSRLGVDVPTGPWRGRVLHEAFAASSPQPAPRVTRRTVQVSAGEYRASVEITTAAGHDYVTSGSHQR